MTVDSLLLQIDNSIEKNQELYVCREGPVTWRGGSEERTYVPLSCDPGDVIAARAWIRGLEKENTEQASQLLDPDATYCAEASRIHNEQRLKIEELEKRRDELLVTIRNLSATVPYADEAGNAGVLLAEVGTLRSLVAEQREMIDGLRGLIAAAAGVDPRSVGGRVLPAIAGAREVTIRRRTAQRDQALYTLHRFGMPTVGLDPDDQWAFDAALAHVRGEPLPPLVIPSTDATIQKKET